MIKIKENKSRFFWFLLIAVMIIWGLIINNIVSILFISNEEIITEVILNTQYEKNMSENDVSKTNIEIDFFKLKRDPFVFPKKVKPKPVIPLKNKFIQPIKLLPPTIDFTINGIIISNNNKLIVLEDKTSKTSHFLNEGDTYKNIKIESITSSKITILENKILREITIN